MKLKKEPKKPKSKEFCLLIRENYFCMIDHCVYSVKFNEVDTVGLEMLEKKKKYIIKELKEEILKEVFELIEEIELPMLDEKDEKYILETIPKLKSNIDEYLKDKKIIKLLKQDWDYGGNRLCLFLLKELYENKIVSFLQNNLIIDFIDDSNCYANVLLPNVFINKINMLEYQKKLSNYNKWYKENKEEIKEEVKKREKNRKEKLLKNRINKKKKLTNKKKELEINYKEILNEIKKIKKMKNEK